MRSCKRCGNTFEPYHERIMVCPDCQLKITEENRKLNSFYEAWAYLEPPNSVARICAYCGDPFWRKKQATKAKYCPDCAEMMKTQKTRERVRRFRKAQKEM